MSFNELNINPPESNKHGTNKNGCLCKKQPFVNPEGLIILSYKTLIFIYLIANHNFNLNDF